MIVAFRAKINDRRMLFCFEEEKEAKYCLQVLKRAKTEEEMKNGLVKTFEKVMFVETNITESEYYAKMLYRYQFYEKINGLIHIICDDIRILKGRPLYIKKSWDFPFFYITKIKERSNADKRQVV